MFFALSRAWDKEKIFLYSLPSSKPYHLSYSIYKHDAIDIADPSSMQDVCHMNFLIDLAHCGVSVVVGEAEEAELGFSLTAGFAANATLATRKSLSRLGAEGMAGRMAVLEREGLVK